MSCKLGVIVCVVKCNFEIIRSANLNYLMIRYIVTFLPVCSYLIDVICCAIKVRICHCRFFVAFKNYNDDNLLLKVPVTKDFIVTHSNFLFNSRG